MPFSLRMTSSTCSSRGCAQAMEDRARIFEVAELLRAK